MRDPIETPPLLYRLLVHVPVFLFFVLYFPIIAIVIFSQLFFDLLWINWVTKILIEYLQPEGFKNLVIKSDQDFAFELYVVQASSISIMFLVSAFNAIFCIMLILLSPKMSEKYLEYRLKKIEINLKKRYSGRIKIKLWHAPIFVILFISFNIYIPYLIGENSRKFPANDYGLFLTICFWSVSGWFFQSLLSVILFKSFFNLKKIFQVSMVN